ncbi:MFS transporter [Caulobacter hibisci]|uniref:MFS transporter n=1 Tax=Caulobacter hibisci TaxID=2035993 RepID=A0ABS0SZ07_9CAUL|nr:MFS transporter [Caulobacter hibisci]MBI1683842.1 MFS transporter [Caulobacter hibisci]
MIRTWLNIVALWLIGVLAAAQLPKIAVLAPVLRETFHLSLAQAGLLVSLLEIGGAVFGIAAGLALGRFGGRRFLVSGLAVLLVTSVVEALAPTVGVLFAARAIEGVGYVLVVIAAPTMIVAIAPDRIRGQALVLWSTFVPVGVAVGSGVTGLAVAATSPKGAMLLWAVLCALGLFAASRQARGTRSEARMTWPAPAAVVLTFGFGLFTVFVCALTMLLPSFLTEQAGASLSGASLATGLVSLTALPASAIAMRILHAAGADPRRAVVATVVPALLAGALVSVFVFHPAVVASGAAAVSVVAGLASLLGGIASPMVFARLPSLAGATGSDDPRIAAANGLLTQFGAGGALIGPPLGGLVVGRWGWQGLGVCVAVLAVAMLAAILAAERMGRAGAESPEADMAPSRP